MHIHQNYRLGWCPWLPPMPFACSYIQFKDNDRLLLGSNNGVVIYVKDFTSYVMESILELQPLFYQMISGNVDMQLLNNGFHWVDIDVLDDAILVSISNIGVHWTKLEDNLHFSSKIEFFGIFDPLDIVTTARRLRRTWLFAIATLKGFIYFFDVKAGVLIFSVFSTTSIPLLHRLGNIMTSDLKVPDAFVCSASVYPSTVKGLPIMQDIWICCIGSIGGNIALCDLHKQRIVSKLHVMEGPILSLAITNNCVVVIGVTHEINDDEQKLIFSLHGETLFCRHVQLLALRHHWRIDVTILDGKQLRSILHLKNPIWETAIVSFPNTKSMSRNMLLKKKRYIGLAIKSSTKLPNFLLESCTDGNLFFYKNLSDYNFQSPSMHIRLPNSCLSFDFYYQKNTDFGLLVCFDYTGTIFYNSVRHFLSKCYHIKNYFPFIDSHHFCNISTKNDNVLLNLETNDSDDKKNMTSFQLQNKNDSKTNGFFQQETSIYSAFLPHVYSYQKEYKKACLVAIQRIFLSKVPFHYRYLPWDVAIFTVQQYTSGNVGYFGKWLSGAYRKTMRVNLLLESFLNREMENLGYSMVDFQNRATSLSFEYPENTQLENSSLYREKLESLHANIWQSYFSPSHRRSFLYNTDTILACFNRLGPSALEPSSRCPMANIFIQIFCYIPTFMPFLQKHFCTRQKCLLCELGFICHMLHQATLEGKGKPCQAKNFINTLECIPEVALLGFMPKKFDTTVSPTFYSVNQSLLKSSEIFIHFLFQELSRDIQRAETSPVQQNKKSSGKEDDFISKLFGWRIKKISNCCDHTQQTNSEPMTRFVLKLLSEKDMIHTSTMDQKNSTLPDFETIFKKALNRSFYHSSFCAQCRKYTLQCHKEQVCHSTKHIVSALYQICFIPPFIVADCGSFNWKECSTDSIPEYLWLSNLQTMRDVNVTTTKPTDLLSKQYTCYILQSVVCQIEEKLFPQISLNMFGEPLESSPLQNETFINNYEDVSDLPGSIFEHLTGYIRIPVSYLSQRLETTYGTLNYSDSTRTSAELTKVKDKNIVNEYRHCSTINDTSDSFSLHNSTAWVHFNDLLITKVTTEEVVRCSTPYKVVVCLVYVQENLYIQSLQSNATSNFEKERLEAHSQIPVTVIETNENLSVHPQASSAPHFVPLTKHEISIIQKRGSLFSIDAEFVLLKKPQDLRDDRYALARISILRAEGDYKGVPGLDCHVVTSEEPLDYLTRFSGLKPGDLNTTHSCHWLTSHKSVYQKLRFLIQHNCRFIGHGIAKDFRILNIFVPSNQTIDTAQLFRLPGHRFLSLKFLTKHLFERDVQTSGLGHDSVADAIAANDLFNHYELLNAQGILPHTLDFLYWRYDYTGY